jgi:hypothetical protein
MSMTPDDFEALIAEVAELNNLPEDLAAEIVSAVGDTPMEEDGKVIAVVRGQEYRLVWPTEDEE